MKSHNKIVLTGEIPKTLEENLSTATSSNTNPTWNASSANLGLRDERQLTNRLNHGTAWIQIFSASQ
jgi:hypothetical protein